MKRMALIVLMALVALAAAPGYKVIDKIKIGGTGTFWDYVFVDADAARLYVSHSNQTEVLDLTSNKVVGTIPETQRVHGIAIASDLGKGFTSNGGTNNVTVFDLKTMKPTGTIATGMNPDAILYDPVSHRVFAFNGRSKDATVIDAKSGTVISTLPVGGKPEFAQPDGRGMMYVNLEDKSEIQKVDTKSMKVVGSWMLAPGEEPTGLGYDSKHGFLFSACANGMMAISDVKTEKVVSTPKIGNGPDGAAYDATLEDEDERRVLDEHEVVEVLSCRVNFEELRRLRPDASRSLSRGTMSR